MLSSSEMGFGEGIEALSALIICAVFTSATASVEVSCCQKSQRWWKEERNEVVGGALAITVIIVMANPFYWVLWATESLHKKVMIITTKPY